MIKNYFKIAYRNLSRNKIYVGINVVGLALSISCCILIFSLVSHHLSFDNFHQKSDRIYRIVTEMHRDNIGYNPNVPSPLAKVFREEYNFGEKVARIATFNNQIINVKTANENKKLKEDEGIAFTETNYFEIFNFPLLKGNLKTALSEPNTVILTENASKKYFGEENSMGKTFWLNNKIALTVTGILKDLPENTDRKTELFASYSTLKQFNSSLASDDSWGGITSGMESYILLRPKITPMQVENVMPAYVKKFRPTSKNVHHYKLQPLSDIHFNANYNGVMEKQYLWILSIIGLFLMVTACVNFINLATAQALKRSKEVGVRKVLGSVKSQIFWQFIAETSLIVALSIVVGLALSYLILPFANDFFQSKITINLLSNYYLPLFLFGLSVIVIFLSGSYPGLILAVFQPVTALKGKISQQSIGGLNTRRSLIVAQFAISQILIIGIIVIISQMKYAKQSDLGFDKDAMVMIPIGADSTGVVMKTLKNQFLQISGVEKVSLCIDAPASLDTWNTSIGFGNQAEEVNFRTNMKSADEDYLETFGLELVAGKNIYPSDSVREFLVNEALIRKLNLKSPKDAIGKMITADGGDMFAPIVGVVKDFHERSFHEEIGAVAIMTYKEDYSKYAIRINMKDAKSTLASIEKAWSAQHPDEIFEYQFLDDNIAKFYQAEDKILLLIQFFSFVAILIGCLGLYGLVSFMVIQKTKEIGIRKVLGSSINQILWIFGKEFSRLIMIAFVISAPLAWYMMNKWLEDFEYQIKITPTFFLYAIASSFVIAALTVGYQSIRAALMNPIKSLKTE